MNAKNIWQLKQWCVDCGIALQHAVERRSSNPSIPNSSKLFSPSTHHYEAKPEKTPTPLPTNLSSPKTMAEVQPSPSPSPSPPPAARDPEDPPLPPPPPPPMQQQPREGGGGRSEDEEDPPSPPLPQSTTVPVSNAAQYIPRVADHTTSAGGDGRSWYSWNGRTKDRRRQTAPPPQRQQPQPYPQGRPQPQQWVPPGPKLPHVPDSPPVHPARPAPSTVPAPGPARSVERDRRAVPDIMYRKRRTATLQRTALFARLVAAALCLAALAVLAADTRKGWALDSYSNYTQLRYSEAVNVIGFVYSVFQFFALALHLTRKRHLIPRPKGDYFDFTMDQVLAYLLISSSSSATARVSDWIDNWGSDTFPNMANSSIIISFLAFVIFAINSLISAYNLFRRDL